MSSHAFKNFRENKLIQGPHSEQHYSGQRSGLQEPSPPFRTETESVESKSSQLSPHSYD